MRSEAVRVRYAELKARGITHRIVRNPQYSGSALSFMGWKSVPVTPATRKQGFFSAMRESIKREGFRNPIVVYALPEGIFLAFGASRLRIAQELDIEIPCLINDVIGRFDDREEVTPDNFDDYFIDPPEWRQFSDLGVEYHYSMERNRRESFDPNGIAWADPDAQFLRQEFPWLGI